MIICKAALSFVIPHTHVDVCAHMSAHGVNAVVVYLYVHPPCTAYLTALVKPLKRLLGPLMVDNTPFIFVERVI